MKKIASLSGGKDSVAMVLKLIEEKWQLDEVVTFDTLWEFSSVYNVIEMVKKICEKNNIKFTVLKRNINSYYEMFVKPIKTRDGSEKFGYGWCGGNCRWNTTFKVQTITNYLKKNYPDGYQEYVGIAVDEPNRVKDKLYPLVEWQMTEKDCLEYCHDNNIYWFEGDIELYTVLDRVSCWCCRNKNIKELRAMYNSLPEYWQKLKGMQSRINEPFKQSGSIYELEEVFEKENEQLELF